ncbi:hypothetical protein OWV82_024523 [Melia azedarach]|uniref:Uncharacterized protein n=1 Tax=Melia azedarach TaxID=155640 RepID=A0ACC1WQ73_MELAZ|nr:hypothetical protein OWV82_024523 [Melia azedarach]
MSTPGYYIADVYVLRKIHKEKLKGREEDGVEIKVSDAEEKNSSGSNFSSMVKKMHSSGESILSSTDYGSCKQLER